MTVFRWSQTAASNATADASVNWREGQAASTVNNSARAMMAALRKFYDDLSGNVVTGGGSTAYTATSNQGYSSAYRDGDYIAVRLHTTNGAAATLNLDSLGAKPIRSSSATAAVAGSLLGGSVQHFTYDLSDDCFYVHSFQPIASTLDTAATKMVFWMTTPPTGWTKDTSHNDKALRIVSGTASTGGSVAFATAFASQTPAGTVGNTTLTTSQIPLHGHPWRRHNGNDDTSSSQPGGGILITNFNNSTISAFTGTPSDSESQSIGGEGGGQAHTHTFTGNAINFAVSYVDCILATKD